MTDPGREVPLVAGDTTYTLYGGNKALRLLERESGQPMLDALEAIERGSIDTITIALWALLQLRHPDLTVDDVDDIIDAAGYEAATEALGLAVDRGFPQASADGAQASGKAPRGTGTKSSPARSRPASASPSSGR